MKGMAGGMQKFIQQANQLQSRIKKLQEELDEKEYKASAGGGAVTITVTGKHAVCAVNISADLMKSGDAEMLQDLILTATNDALSQATKEKEEKMNALTGGMALPGLM